MLRATRLVTASKRGFATVVDASPGFKVAAVDNGQPTSSVTVLLKAGSRYESKPGRGPHTLQFCFQGASSLFTTYRCSSFGRPLDRSEQQV
jgi:ubiquinol-cytochrome c reductase core subunit 2